MSMLPGSQTAGLTGYEDTRFGLGRMEHGPCMADVWLAVAREKQARLGQGASGEYSGSGSAGNYLNTNFIPLGRVGYSGAVGEGMDEMGVFAGGDPMPWSSDAHFAAWARTMNAILNPWQWYKFISGLDGPSESTESADIIGTGPMQGGNGPIIIFR